MTTNYLSNNKEKTDKELKEIPIGIKWEWDEANNCLTYKANVTLNEKIDKKKGKDRKIDLRTGVPRLTTQNRQKPENKFEIKKPINANVTLNDVKIASLNMLSERYYIPKDFENYCNDSNSKVLLDEFLIHLANYFHWFFEEIDSKKITNPMCIEKSVEEKQRTEHATVMLKKTLKSVARYYCKLLLGLDASDYHHMNCGKNRVSSGFKDRGIYETLYPYCIFFVWILFKRRDYEVIRNEVGRILRSESFNSSIKVESILEDENEIPAKIKEIKNKNKMEILNKHKENNIFLENFSSKIDKKMNVVVLNKRSPALVSILPRPEENSKWLFEKRSLSTNGKSLVKNDDSDSDEEIDVNREVGIIGQPLKLFNIKTLAVRGNNENDTDNQPEQNETINEPETLAEDKPQKEIT